MKSKIEWTNYTINPVKGLCPMACPYCYARRMYKRFHRDESIRFDEHALNEAWDIIRRHKNDRQRIFVGSTIELFGDWVRPEWMERILSVVKRIPEHDFIFLTKQPQNLSKWSPFPENCWIGASATNAKMAEEAGFWLWEVKAGLKFVSFEPLLERIPVHFSDYIEGIDGIKWVIIGQQTPTNAKTAPKVEWIREIVGAADQAGVPVFLKDNLGWPRASCDGSPPFYKRQAATWLLRQEIPRKRMWRG